MKYIIEQKHINMPRLMMNYIWEAATKRHSSLSYGMVLTQLFKKFRVPIHEEEPKRALRHTNMYNCATLRRMRFQKINNEWIRKNEPFEEAPHVAEPTTTPRESSPIPSPIQTSEIPASSSYASVTKEELLTIVNSMFEDLKEYVYESQRESIKEMQAFKEES